MKRAWKSDGLQARAVLCVAAVVPWPLAYHTGFDTPKSTQGCELLNRLSNSRERSLFVSIYCGYVRLSRDLWNDPFFRTKQPVSRREAFWDLVVHARGCDNTEL